MLQVCCDVKRGGRKDKELQAPNIVKAFTPPGVESAFLGAGGIDSGWLAFWGARQKKARCESRLVRLAPQKGGHYFCYWQSSGRRLPGRLIQRVCQSSSSWSETECDVTGILKAFGARFQDGRIYSYVLIVLPHQPPHFLEFAVTVVIRRIQCHKGGCRSSEP